MLNLIDGPCKGTYLAKRAPVFLRAVKGKDNAGNTDVLDQVEDTPSNAESVYVYHLQGEAGWIHLKMSPRSRSGSYALGEYKYLPDVDGEALRDNTAWQGWATAHFAASSKVDECTPKNPCCDRRNEYNGFGSGPLKFTCPKHCSCHD